MREQERKRTVVVGLGNSLMTDEGVGIHIVSELMSSSVLGNDVDFVLGLAKNERLQQAVAEPLEAARQRFEQTGEAARVFKDFRYQTLESWSRPRRVVGKAEHLAKGANPRFVVTSLPAEGYPAQILYEVEYCGRGDMENRIKEQQHNLFADRTSATTMRANELRLWFSSAAYTLLSALRRGRAGPILGR